MGSLGIASSAVGEFPIREPLWKRPAFAIVPAVSVLVLLVFSSHIQKTVFNNYVLLADAWLHHRAWIYFPGPWIDAVPYHGRAYIYEAPFPAILMLPFVALFGTQTNQTLVGMLVASVGVGGVWRFCQNCALGIRECTTITLFFVFSTSYFVCAFFGHVWYLAHVCAAAFTFLALSEMFGKRRVLLVTLWAVCAAFSRFPLLVAIPCYITCICVSRRSGVPAILSMAILVPVAALYTWYNEARWGTWQDIGFTYFYYVMDPRSKLGIPPFSVTHVPMQLQSMFVSGLLLRDRFPWAYASQFGTAITWTSPALVLALLAPIRRHATRMVWMLALLTAIPALLYYDTGEVQFGFRHALDFEPFLLALMVLAVRTKPLQWWSWALLLASIVFSLMESVLWINRAGFS